METGELACEKRATRPKGQNNALRRSGRVPAILYGPTTAPMALAIDRLELKARISAAAHTRIIKLKSSTAELDGKHVIFKDVQRAPVSGEILHADLYEVDLNRAIRVEVPLKFIGKAKGVANGGILRRWSAPRRWNACRWRFPTRSRSTSPRSTSTTSSTSRR